MAESKKFTTIYSRAKQNSIVITFITALFVFSLLLLIFLLAENLILSDENAKHFHLWFQFICGNWPPFHENTFPRTSIEFSAALTSKVILALGPLGGVLFLFWRMTAFERRYVMTIMDLLRIRDSMIKTQILGKIPPSERQRFESYYNDAFQQASQRWAEQQLPNLVGNDQAKMIIERLERESL